MPKRYSGTCEQCGEYYTGYGVRFCGNHCRVTWTNLHRNVAWRDDVKLKIGAASKNRKATLGRVLPESQKQNIARTLRGRKLTPQRRENIRQAALRRGARPPVNTHLRGPLHPQWKGGHSPSRNSDWTKPEYKAFRKAVLERDNYTCQDCGQHGYQPNNKLEVHHIKPWGPYPELRYEVSNGMTLCFRCHNKTKRVPRPLSVEGHTLAARLSGLSLVASDVASHS